MPGARTRKPRAPARPRLPRRSRLEVDERRAQLVEFGLEFFSTHAYDEVSVDDLASAAGISKGLLYHYFPTKRDYYVATIREAARQLLERSFKVDASLPPLERARGGLDAYLDYVEGRGPAYVALLRGGIGSDPEIASILEQTRAAFAERILASVPGIELTPFLRMAVRGWIGLVETTSLEWVETRELARDAVRDFLIEVLFVLVNTALARMVGA